MDIGVVGHRNLDERAQAFTASICASVLDARPRCALSALAVGADTLFAQAALRRDVTLHAFRPHDDYASDFADSSAALAEYRRLSAAATRATHLPFGGRSDAAYRAAMRAIVDLSDVLVAVWDGHDSDAVGGTADTVRYARARGRRMIVVDPVRQVVRHG